MKSFWGRNTLFLYQSGLYLLSGLFFLSAWAGAPHPGTPSYVSVPSSDTDGNYTISWGGTDLAEWYEIREDSGQNYRTSSTSLSITGKADGTYRYDVRACSDARHVSETCGPYKAGSSVTVQRPPGVPSSLTVPISDNDGDNISISWGSASGSQLTYYLYESKNGASFVQVYSSTGYSTSLSGRGDGSYRYQVKACNSVCGGDRSGNRTLTIVKIPGKPGKPTTGVSASEAKKGLYTITWSESSGSVSHYILQAKHKPFGGSWGSWKTQTSNKALFPRANGEWNYAVAGCNKLLGAEQCSSFAYILSPVTVFKAPKFKGPAEIETVNGSEATISWDPVDGATHYYLKYNGEFKANEISGTSLPTLSNLREGNHYYSIQAAATGRLSHWSDLVVVRSHYDEITVAPTMTSATVQTTTNAKGDIKISWDAVPGAYDYRVFYGAVQINKSSPRSISFTYKDQEINKSYTFTVYACTAAPQCGPAASQTITLNFKKAKNLKGSCGGLSCNTRENIDLVWSGVGTYALLRQTRNGSTTYFTDRHRESADINTPNKISLTRSEPGEYTFAVKLCVEVDGNQGSDTCSAYGEDVTINVMPPPDTPPTIHIPGYVENNSVTVSWGAAGGVPHEYELEHSRDGETWTNVYTGPETVLSTLVDGLFEGRGQYFRVRACNTFADIRLCSAEYRTSDKVYVAAAQIEEPQVESPPLEPTAVGVLAGNGSVSGGAANYQIPIKVVPGRNDMQPEVSLNYSNRSGNGIVGMGWSLSGGSRVHRCAATQAQDSFSASIQFDPDRDRLCLDGQRLVNISGTYGQDGAVYRTELDSFVRVKQFGYINSFAAYFEVEYKNGRTSVYGKTFDSRHVPKGKVNILNWAVSSSQDPSGNTMNYQYKCWGYGECAIQSISYTGHTSDASLGNRSVEFDYQKRVDGNGKTDFSSVYMNGGLVRQTRRLKTIRTKYQDTTVREYTLFYGNMSLSSGRSLLRSIQECAFDKAEAVCMPETRFDWQEAAPSFVIEPIQFRNGDGTVSAHNNPSVSKIVPRGDVNGDGVRDWPGEDNTHDNIPDVDGYYVNAEGEVVGTHRESVGGCFKAFAALSPTCLDADFNQDGRSDSFVYNILDRKFNIRYAGTSTWVNTGINLQYLFDKPLGFGDFNGDGWPDIVVQESDEAPYAPNVYIYLNTQNPQAPFNDSKRVFIYQLSTLPVEGNIVYKQNVQVQGDMDGNGTPDFVVFIVPSLQDDSPGMPEPDKIIFTHSQLNDQMTLSEYAFSGHLEMDDLNLGESHFFYDINGDGLLDWLSMNRQHYLEAKINQGGFFADDWQNLGVKLPTRVHFRELTENEPEPYVLPNMSKVMAMDYNGDGKTELLVAKNIVSSAIGCGQVALFKLGQRVVEEMCGDELWGSVKKNSGSNSYSPINGERKDISARRYHAIYFEEDIKGKIITRVRSTNIVAATTERMAIDATGNGLTDVVTTFTCKITGCRLKGSVYQEGVAYINRNIGASSDPNKYESIDVIKTITNGFDVENHWVYRPLGSDEYDTSVGSFYTPDHSYIEGEIADSDQEYFHFGASLNVVAEHKVSNGVGGLNSTRYRYSGATYNNQGRGFMGFRSITVDNLAQDIKTKTIFHQKWPMAGLIEQSCTWLSGENESPSQCGNAISEVNIEYKAPIATTAKTVWVGVDSEQKVSRDLKTRTHLSTDSKHGYSYDNYGNILNITTSHNDDYGIVTHHAVNIYETNETTWWLNKLVSNTKTFDSIIRGTNALSPEADTDNKKVIVSNYPGWHATHRRPTEVNIVGGKKTATKYSTYGLPDSVTVSAEGVDARQSVITYTIDGYFAEKLTNALNHETEIVTDETHGQPTSVTDANGLVTTTKYDVFGRANSITAPGQAPINTEITLCDTICNEDIISESLDHVAYQVNVTQEGRPDQTQYFDRLGQVVLVKQTAFDGGHIFNKVNYDALGRKTFESVPYHATEPNDIGTHYNSYDALGRLTAKTIDQAMANTQFTTSYNHNKYTTTITADTLTLSRSYNALGQLMQTVDAKDGQTRYAYDSAGNPIAIEDADGNIISSRFDHLNRKDWVDDPNMGLKSFTYNGLGEVIDTVDAKLNKLTNVYDDLGRVTTVKLNNITDSSWVYDTRLKGQLTSHSRDGGLKSFYYDTSGRLSRTEHTIDGLATYNIEQHYDSLGRPSGMAYSGGPTVNYNYNTSGYLYQHSNAAGGYVYTETIEQDAWQHATRLTLADNSINEATDYYANTGQMKSILTTRQSDSTTVHHIGYDNYDVFGNLKEKTTRYSNASTTETFSYDHLHRLTQSVRNGAVNETVDYDYNATGNLILKSDYASSYIYTGTGNCGSKPNAVCQITKTNNTTVNFDYDANGNLTGGDGKTVTYDAYNKPVTIEQGSIKSTFHYGADLARYKQIKQDMDANADTTIYYLDKHMEVIDQSGLIKTRYYLNDYVILEKTQDPLNDISFDRLSFLHKDRLGSIATITDESGTILERRGFDPFGKPRDGNWGDKTPPRLDSNNTDRGFTGHEHLDDQQLIHMNGRIYDYNLGRFYSVDPYIQAPENTQSINPYSYIMNNPLAGIDPTGYRCQGRACRGSVSSREHAMSHLSNGQKAVMSERIQGGLEGVAVVVVTAVDVADQVSDVVAPVKGVIKMGVKKAIKEGIEQVAKKNGKQDAQGVRSKTVENNADIGSDKKVVDIELNYKRNPKHDKSEFDRQASEQKEGLEKQTAGEVKENIESFRTNGRKEGNKAVAEYKKKNGSPESGDHVTHRTDCCAGGKPDDISGTGNGAINSSLGRQNANQSDNIYNAVKDAPSDASVRVHLKVDDKLK